MKMDLLRDMSCIVYMRLSAQRSNWLNPAEPLGPHPGVLIVNSRRLSTRGARTFLLSARLRCLWSRGNLALQVQVIDEGDQTFTYVNEIE